MIYSADWPVVPEESVTSRNRRNEVHNRSKLPVSLVCFVLGIALSVWGVLSSSLDLVIEGGIATGLCALSIAMILRGRNPWWMRSPRDPQPLDDQGLLTPDDLPNSPFKLPF